jgi:membrane protein
MAAPQQGQARHAGSPAAPQARIPPPLPKSAPPHRRLARTVERLVRGLYLHNTGDVAPSMAFHFFLSLVPLLVLVGFVIGQIARQRGVDALLGPAIETAPDAVEQLVRDELARMAGANASSIAPLSVLGFLWIAATGAHGLMDAFELASGAPRRRWWKKRAISLLWVAGMLAALGAIAWGAIGVDTVVQRASLAPQAASAPAGTSPAPSATAAAAARQSAHRSASGTSSTSGKVDRDASDAGIVRHARRKLAPLLHEPWERIAVVLVFALTSLTSLAGFYRFAVEHPPGVERRAWPGAIVAFTGWLLVSWGFGVYVSSLGRYALFYGSVATVAVLLVWFYLTSWALLVGAELNAQLEGLRDA